MDESNTTQTTDSPDYECEDCIGMKEHGCYCQAMGATRPGGPAGEHRMRGHPQATLNAGWIEPPDPHLPAEYELTRRSAHAEPGYGLDLPDETVRYRWSGQGYWISGYREGNQRREAVLVRLHSGNGWRLGERTTDVAQETAEERGVPT